MPYEFSFQQTKVFVKFSQASLELSLIHGVLNNNLSLESNLLFLTPSIQQAEAGMASAMSAVELQAEQGTSDLPVQCSEVWIDNRKNGIRDLTA